MRRNSFGEGRASLSAAKRFAKVTPQEYAARRWIDGFFWPAVVSMALVMLRSAQASSVAFSIALSSLKRHPGRSNGSAQHLKS